MSPAELRRLIAASGLSIREWAVTVAGRSPRTVERWLAGYEMSAAAADWLARVHDVHVTANRVTVTVERRGEPAL